MTYVSHDQFDRRCPHQSCERSIPRHLFACRDHWYQLPKRIRMGIERNWRALMYADLDEDREDERLEYRRFVTLAVAYWRNQGNPALNKRRERRR